MTQYRWWLILKFINIQAGDTFFLNISLSAGNAVVEIFYIMLDLSTANIYLLHDLGIAHIWLLTDISTAHIY